MDDYIRRKAAQDAFTEVEDLYYPEWGNTRYTPKDVEKILDSVPAADVAHVVYCKDCIHRPYSTEPGKTNGFAVEAPDRECKCPCFNSDDGWYSWIPDDYFFCADGERRGADMGGADG